MSFVLQPWQLLVGILAGWVSQRQQEAIEYLRTENQVLRETLGQKRILLNDAQRRRLAVKGKFQIESGGKKSITVPGERDRQMRARPGPGKKTNSVARTHRQSLQLKLGAR